jgi:hypothetical protein
LKNPLVASFQVFNSTYSLVFLQCHFVLLTSKCKEVQVPLEVHFRTRKEIQFGNFEGIQSIAFVLIAHALYFRCLQGVQI